MRKQSPGRWSAGRTHHSSHHASRIEEKDATSVLEAFTRRLVDIPSGLRLSLNDDQGKKMNQHRTLVADLSLFSYQLLAAYQEILNARPRRIIGWKSPLNASMILYQNLFTFTSKCAHLFDTLPLEENCRCGNERG